MASNLIVHGGWLDQSFFIWGEEPPRSRFDQVVNFQYPFMYPPFELKLTLFRYDQASFFGTFIESEKAVIDVPLDSRSYSSLAGTITVYQAQEQMTHYSFPIEGLIFPVEGLVAHLATFSSWYDDEDIELAPDLKSWLAIFAAIQTEIINGAFTPAASGQWTLSSFPFDEWFESLPLSARSIRPNTSFIQKGGHAPLSVDSFRQLVTAVADEMIRSFFHEEEVRHAYQSWVQTVEPKWRTAVAHLTQRGKIDSPLSSEVFQQEIGALQARPFRSGLVLKEPATSTGMWQLSLCMVDRKHPSLLVDMEQLQLGEHPWRENPIAQLKQDLKKAQTQLPLLKELRLSSPVLSLTAEQAYELFTEQDEQLSASGFHLIVPKWMTTKKKPKVKLAVTHPLNREAKSEPLLDWQSVASFTYELAIGDQAISPQEFHEFVDGQRPFLYANGEWIAWDRSLAEQLRTYLQRIEEEASFLEAWRDDQLAEEESESFELDISWGNQLTSALKELYSATPSLIDLPEQFTGELRPYQHEGVSWLAHLRRTGFGGCLADDMGLGKSIQTIVYILYVLEEQRKAQQEEKPFLLICPTSLLYNWVQECKQFAPTLRLFVHHGKTRLTEEQCRQAGSWDLVLTSYQLAVRDHELLHGISWNGLILDEAQHIKNVDTKQRRVIKEIKATHRIALTGTPIENRLRELWSLLDVLNPGYLGTYQDFQASFMRPIEKEQDEEQLAKLQKLIHPLILRRKKSDEALQLGLPEKKEHIHRVHLSVEQAALYQAVVDDIVGKLDEVSALERRALILRSLTKLKQICNHPAHFLKETTLRDHQSGKWQTLLELTDQMVERRQKVLLFSQYKEMGMLMTEALEERYKETVPFLHGSLTRAKRQQAIERFQSDNDCHFFVLSLKAGGVGLNLTAATHVIHYDRWWNPAVENQATDRAYRIGQTKDVTVHKLMTVGTLEERIDRMLTQKQALADHILAAGEQPITELTNEEIIDLIQLTR
ncbi:DEAD/DEAH box helicase [Alkalihalobacillus oceani]|uniref:DEAD/DEAH box helicase n=1 Tax=Halalkalibacter oceani TaxID=1653776 RepID=A0A9X2INR2_9BACI|nr:DEAD/DEAH box helicase [Halalkalibacter oceani]MCM3715174.1 DEAD/DEAH box helicase [Halalkalibacter oceani]